ncbi:MAG: F0F1 ATP synthase subunit delta [Pseudomonadota bacterium]
MSDTVSYSAEIAARYATAIFELAKDSKKLPTLGKDIAALQGALNDSLDLSEMIRSPIYTRDEQKAAVAEIAKKMKLSPTMGNALQLMAEKRRLFTIPALLKQLTTMIAEENGETTAEVTSAKKLTKAQADKLAKTLSEKVGKKVQIQAEVDESLIGGLIVKIGSRMIDSSIRSKLAKLENAMKEVG